MSATDNQWVLLESPATDAAAAAPARYYATFTVSLNAGTQRRQAMGGVVTLRGERGAPDPLSVAVEIARRLQTRADQVRILQVARLH